MAYTFPNTPAEGDIYTPASGAAFIFNEGVWRRSSATTVSGYVLKTGDVMTGALVLPDPNPAAALHATHKRYVDEMVATQSLWQSVWGVASNTPDLDPAVVLPLHGYTWTAVTVDPAVPELAPATLPGIGGKSIGSNDSIVWNENALQYEHVPIPLGASAMLVADAPPAGAFHGQMWWDSDSGKQYCYFDDGTSQQWVQVSGGGGSGPMVPVSDTPPTPAQGKLWFNSADASLYCYFDDGTGGAWIEVSAP